MSCLAEIPTTTAAAVRIRKRLLVRGNAIAFVRLGNDVKEWILALKRRMIATKSWYQNFERKESEQDVKSLDYVHGNGRIKLVS